jgi:dihydroneopterin aldolase
MEFFAHHGCFDEERTTGTYFEVDVDVHLNLQQAATTDNLNDTLNYQSVYNIVRKEMQQPSNLLEHVAGRLLHALFEQCETVDRAIVTVRKRNPPLGGKVGYSAVTLKKRRERKINES